MDQSINIHMRLLIQCYERENKRKKVMPVVVMCERMGETEGGREAKLLLRRGAWAPDPRQQNTESLAGGRKK